MKRAAIPAIVLMVLSAAAAGQESEWIHVAGGSWNPDPNTLTAVQRSIESYVRVEAQHQKRELRPWESYTFQYRGYVDRGRQFIRINALCSVIGEAELYAHFYEVFDGGPCYFRVVYDAKKSRFKDLTINGPG